MGAYEPIPDEEHALWQRWRGERDQEARERLVEIHLPYAKLVAASYYGKRYHDEIGFDEYLQLASLGLVEAMERFDPDLGVQFRSFASRRMHGAIVDGLERATEKQQQIAARQRLEAQRRASLALADEHEDGEERPPTAAARTTDQVLQYVAEAGLAFALSWLLDGSGMVDGGHRVETIPFYRSIELKELRQRILEMVAALPAQEKHVIQGHYLHDQPFERIATALNLSRGRISQIHRRALLHLRERLKDVGPCDVLA